MAPIVENRTGGSKGENWKRYSYRNLGLSQQQEKWETRSEAIKKR